MSAGLGPRGDVEADSSSSPGQAAQLSVTESGRKRLESARAILSDYEAEADADADADDLRGLARAAASASWKMTVHPPVQATTKVVID